MSATSLCHSLTDANDLPIKYALHILLVLGFWGTPLLRLSPSATWPLSIFFAFPRLGLGAMGTSAAMAMVKAAMAPLGPWLASV